MNWTALLIQLLPVLPQLITNVSADIEAMQKATCSRRIRPTRKSHRYCNGGTLAAERSEQWLRQPHQF
jgi:hypothetical protein